MEVDAFFPRIQSSVQEAAKTLPTVKPPQKNTRTNSQATINLVAERRRRCQSAAATAGKGGKITSEVRAVEAEFHKAIAHSARKDQRDHVETLIDAVVDADDRNNSKDWWKAVHRRTSGIRYCGLEK